MNCTEAIQGAYAHHGEDHPVKIYVAEGDNSWWTCMKPACPEAHNHVHAPKLLKRK